MGEEEREGIEKKKVWQRNLELISTLLQCESGGGGGEGNVWFDSLQSCRAEASRGESQSCSSFPNCGNPAADEGADWSCASFRDLKARRKRAKALWPVTEPLQEILRGPRCTGHVRCLAKPAVIMSVKRFPVL